MKRFLNKGNFSLLLDSIESGENVSVFGLNIGEKLALVEDSAFLFYVVESLDKVNEVFDKLTALGRTCEILTDYLSPLSSEFLTADKYIQVLGSLRNQSIDTLIISPEVLAGKFPQPQSIMHLQLSVGDNVNVTDIIKNLSQCNYTRVDLVANVGEFSVRGDVIDIYPIGHKPTRIFIDYDTIESIKLYNPITMLTTSDIPSLTISTNKYFNITESELKEIYESRKLKIDETYEELLQLKNSDYRLILLDKNISATIFDYVDGGTIVFDGTKAIYEKLDTYIQDYNSKIVNFNKSLEVLAKEQKLDIKQLLKFPSNFNLIAFHYIQQANRIFNPQRVFSIRALPATNYYNYFDALMLDIGNFSKQNYTIILCAGNAENAAKLSDKLQSQRVSCNVAVGWSFCSKNSLNIVQKNYPLDILLPEEKLIIISTESLFGKKKKVVDVDNKFFDGDVPKKDDYVVHAYHGIGKCLGVETLNISNNQRDYIIIEYKNNDKLYLPVENMDQLSKYLGSEKAPTLNKIGGVEFSKTKERIKSAVKKIAFDLISLYRDRMNLKGLKYNKDDAMQEDFEKSFGFSEKSYTIQKTTIGILSKFNDRISRIFIFTKSKFIVTI